MISFNGWGVTMVDSLDTMFLMGLHDEFQRGVKLAENMTFFGSNVSTCDIPRTHDLFISLVDSIRTLLSSKRRYGTLAVCSLRTPYLGSSSSFRGRES